jgi:hypothetical protein
MNLRHRGTFLGAAGIAVLLALPVPAFSAESKSLEALAAESATGAEQHQALAAYYKDKASAARAEAKSHQGMALSYSSHSAGAAAGMTSHCNNLAKAATSAAAEYDALAAFHESEAKKAK